MHVQIVTYGLDGMTEGEYIDIATRLAPRFAALPGLLAKVWLESPADGVYGAVYLWEDLEAMERFLATDLFEGTNPDFADLGSDNFSVLENLTRATQPALTVLDDPAPRGRAPSRSVAPKAAPPAVARAPRAVKAAPVTRATKVSPAAKAVKAAKAPRAAAAPARPSRARPAAPADPAPASRAKPRPPAARPRRPAG